MHIDNEKGPIKYGDLIFLNIFENEDNNELTMYSKGYIDNQVNFKHPDLLNSE